MNSASQELLRKRVKMIKAMEDISYKIIAEDLLDMKYNSFINWLHGYSNLGYTRSQKLRDYIDCLEDR